MNKTSDTLLDAMLDELYYGAEGIESNVVIGQIADLFEDLNGCPPYVVRFLREHFISSSPIKRCPHPIAENRWGWWTKMGWIAFIQDNVFSTEDVPFHITEYMAGYEKATLVTPPTFYWYKTVADADAALELALKAYYRSLGGK